MTRNRRVWIFLGIALLILAVLACGLFLIVRSVSTPPSGSIGGGTDAEAVVQTAPPPTLPPIVGVIIASRDIPRGAQLTVQDVSVMNWPLLSGAPPPAGSMQVAAGEEGTIGLEQVAGRAARVDILNGQPVLDFMLTTPGEPVSLRDAGSDAALLIPSGQIAFAIPISRFSSVSYAIREGDHVGLAMSFHFVDVDEEYQTILPNDALILPGNLGAASTSDVFPLGREEDGPLGTTLLVIPKTSEGSQRPRQTTQVVIEDVTVLRLGEWPLGDVDQSVVVTPAPPATPASDGDGGQQEPTPLPTVVPAPDVVTLMMTRQDALVLKYALETGVDIDMILGSAVDDEINSAATESVTLQYIIDFYNVALPPILSIAQDPRIDTSSPGVSFGTEPTPTPVPVDHEG